MNKVFIKTYGCQMNERETNALAALLTQRGYEMVSAEAEADIILLNTCSVRDLAEQKAIGKAGHLFKDNRRKPKRIIGIMGCMAQNRSGTLLKDLPQLDLVVGTQRLHKIPDYLDRLQIQKSAGEVTPIIDNAPDRSAQDILKEHFLPTPKASAPVSIMQGCNMACAYCIVPQTRGPEQSRPMAAILEEIENLAQRGIQEVMLLGQIVTSYGRQELPFIAGKSPFVQLLEKIHTIPGIQRIRFASPHPCGFKEDLIEAFGALPKLGSYVHIPLQSGSDALLRAMNRPYSSASFQKIVDRLREKLPDICISTDIIVGFPGESAADFEATRQVFERNAFDMAYIFKYSLRKGTPAQALGDPIPEEEKETRNQTLLELLSAASLKRNQSLIGSTQEVLVEGPAKKGGVYWGRNPGFRKVLFAGNSSMIGKMVAVKIEKATVSTLMGTCLLDENQH